MSTFEEALVAKTVLHNCLCSIVMANLDLSTHCLCEFYKSNVIRNCVYLKEILVDQGRRVLALSCAKH